jgi:hypothetical protein
MGNPTTWDDETFWRSMAANARSGINLAGVRRRADGHAEVICESCGEWFARWPCWGPSGTRFCFQCVSSGAAYGRSASPVIETTGGVVERLALPAQTEDE